VEWEQHLSPMKLIEQLLTPDKVDLALEAEAPWEAVEKLFARLQGDPEISDFDRFCQVVRERNAPPIVEAGRGILIAHGRSSAVHSIVLAAGRLVEPKPDAGEGKLSLVFIAGIPAAFDSEYLRVVGAIARACNSPETFSELVEAHSATRFIELLGASEKRLV